MICCDPVEPMDCEERSLCPQVGTLGHEFCGVCPVHNEPRHRCGCPATSAKETQ